MINDVSQAFDDWLEPLTLIRKSVGSYVNGVWVDGVNTNVNVLAVIQNAQPNDMLLLPEGTRSTEAVKFHTTSRVYTVSEVGETTADTFSYDGDTYIVYDVYKRRIGNYFKAIAMRVIS